MKCNQCNKTTPHTHVQKKISSKGFPTHEKGYAAAHEAADKAEKKKYGSTSYDALKKLTGKAGKEHKLIGKNTKSGRIEVSKSVAPKYRAEVAYHERVENKKLKGKKK